MTTNPPEAPSGRPLFLSHARNAEDVVLARVFADRPAGFWVDVGADPDGSVTRHLASSGWTGVDIPAPATAPQGAEAAPSLAGAEPAPIALDTIFAEQAPKGGVDLLRVATGGTEAAILATAAFTATRPVLVLVAATDATGAPSHQRWHRRLVGARYSFALFDGLNRFYLRQEDAAKLMPRLIAPANVLDAWRPAADAARLAALEAELGELREAAAPTGGVAMADPELAGLRLAAERVAELDAELAALREANRRDAAAEADAAAMAEQLVALRSMADQVPALEAELAAARAATQRDAAAAAAARRGLETAREAARRAEQEAAAAAARIAALEAELAARPADVPGAKSDAKSGAKSGGALGWLTGGGRKG